MVSIVSIAAALVLDECEAVLVISIVAGAWKLWMSDLQSARSSARSWNVAANETTVTVKCQYALPCSSTLFLDRIGRQPNGFARNHIALLGASMIEAKSVNETVFWEFNGQGRSRVCFVIAGGQHTVRIRMRDRARVCHDRSQ